MGSPHATERKAPEHLEPPLWLIFFIDQGKRGWWDWFTRPGFRHVTMLTHYNGNWTMVECSSRRFRIRYMLPDEIETLMRSAGDVLVVSPGIRNEVHLPRMFTCVGLVKHLLGVGWPLVLTPFQLYRKLLESGHGQHFLSEQADCIGAGPEPDCAVG
jgi:hypothetical protein